MPVYVSAILMSLKINQTCFDSKNEYSTAYSQAVTHPSTNAAQCCLTSVIGRELVFSTWYGRIQYSNPHFSHWWILFPWATHSLRNMIPACLTFKSVRKMFFQQTKKSPSNRIWTSDLWISACCYTTTVHRSTNWAIEGLFWNLV